MFIHYWRNADWWARGALIFSLLLLIFGFYIIFHFLVVLNNHYFISDKFNAPNMNETGQIGDYVGGIAGTFFALIGSILLFATLMVQSRQMSIQIDELDRTEKSIQVQNFENRFFELIKLHRDNVAEIKLGDSFGKKNFVLMLREFRAAHDITKNILNVYYLNNEDRKESLKIAYLAFFYGTGPNSTRILGSTLKEYPAEFVNGLTEQLDFHKDIVRKKRKFKFTPFEGHQSRLGHYYRHLYQSIQYVHSKELNINKYEYVKTIRAQLSNHEQALLFLNSLTFLGKSWWDQGFMITYRMVQNIPENFFDPIEEIDITKYFSKGYFEWEFPNI